MTVGVVVPTYNSAQLVTEAIDSILSQTPPPDQVVVVDDGSTDDTSLILERYQGQLEYIRQPNGGPSVARNRGWRQLKTDTVLFLDADDILLPGALSRRLSLLAAGKGVWGYTDGILQDDSGVRWPFSRTYPPKWDDRGDGILRVLLCRNFITASSMIVRRDTLQRVGGFDELIRGTEDWDLAIRLAIQGPVKYSPEPTFIQRLIPNSLSSDREAMNRMRYTTLVRIHQRYPAQVRSAGSSARRSVADAYNWYGYTFASDGRWHEAMPFLWTSIRLWPWQRRGSFLLVMSLLRSGLIRRLRRRKVV